MSVRPKKRPYLPTLRPRQGGACVVHERVMRTWLRVAQATLLPERAAAESFMGPLRSGFGRCSCASQTRP